MLIPLNKLAIKLFPLRSWIYAVGGTAFVCFIYQLLIKEEQQHLLFLSVLLMVWSLLLSLLLHSFKQLPSPLAEQAKFFARLKSKLHHALMSVLLLLFALASLATIFMTYRLISFGFYR